MYLHIWKQLIELLQRHPSLRIDNKDFDVLKKKSKDYYLLIKSRKAQFPNNLRFLKYDFNLTDDQLKKVFILPRNQAFEPYVKAFQYKILNSIFHYQQII